MRLCRLDLDPLEIFVRDDDVLVFLVFVTFDNVFARDFLAIGLSHFFITNTAVVRVTQQPKIDCGFAGGRQGC